MIKSKTRLYHCWENMKQRSSKRDNCEVFAPWNDFDKFRHWSVINGYSNVLVLCRDGDTGNYEPGNVRWDTKKNNSIECLAKMGTIISPCGDIFSIYNMREFCRKEGLHPGHISQVLRGRRLHHKGWKRN